MWCYLRTTELLQVRHGYILWEHLFLAELKNPIKMNLRSWNTMGWHRSSSNRYVHFLDDRPLFVENLKRRFKLLTAPLLWSLLVGRGRWRKLITTFIMRERWPMVFGEVRTRLTDVLLHLTSYMGFITLWYTRLLFASRYVRLLVT